jgi:hypothetical protein
VSTPSDRVQSRIFLCHAREDKLRVMELYRQLKNAGYRPWLDKYDLLPGQNWRGEIGKIIRDPYNLILICLSRNSVTKRGVVQSEIKWALDILEQMPEETVYLIPVRLEECQVPERLSELHWVDLFEPDSFDYLKRALDFELSQRYRDIETLLRSNKVTKSEIAFEASHRRYALASLRDAWSEAAQNLDNPKRFESAVKKIFQTSFGNLIVAYEKNSSFSTNNQFFMFSLNIRHIFEGIDLPDRIPIVFSNSRKFTRAEIDRLKFFLSNKESASIFSIDRLRGLFSNKESGSIFFKVALLIVFADLTNIREVEHLLDKFNKNFAYDIILLEQESLEYIFRAEDPTKALREFVLKRIDLLSVSPFITKGPTNDSVFFGREQELREVSEHLRSASYACIGGRRIGKSSFLGRLHRLVLPKAGFCSLYHDCSTTPTPNLFLTTSVRNWQPPLPNKAITFDQLIKSLPTNKPLVLLLDEADILITADRRDGWPLFNMLRALSNSGRAQVVLSGERTLRDSLRDPTGPLFNFTNEILLGPLDYQAVEELVTRPMRQMEIELENEHYIIQLIWDFTSGHPNIIQHLCRRLIEYLNKQGTRVINSEIVEVIIDDPKFQEEDFLETYWERATPLERIISLLMAQQEKPYSLQAVLNLLTIRDLHPEPEVVKAALDRLVYLRSILVRNPVGYEFAVKAFPKVLTKSMTVEDLLIDLKSQYLKNPMELTD